MYNCIYVSEKERAVDRGVWTNTVDREEREIGGGSERESYKEGRGTKEGKVYAYAAKARFSTFIETSHRTEWKRGQFLSLFFIFLEGMNILCMHTPFCFIELITGSDLSFPLSLTFLFTCTFLTQYFSTYCPAIL